jgi:ATP-binding cassette subfamily C protein/ATP-binding cassette subfamily C protein EexD
MPALRAVFGLSIFINLTLFAIPLYSLQVYDRVLASRNLNTLLMLTLIVAVFLVLYGILEFARSGILVRGGVRFSENISRPVFELAMRAQLAGHPSSAAQALKDAETLRESLSSGTVSALFDVPWTPVFAGICYMFHPALGAVAFGGMILIFTFALLAEVITRNRLQEASRHAAEAQRFSTDSLRNAETISGLGMGSAALARWLGKQNNALSFQVDASEWAALITTATKVVRLSVQIALIGTGAWLAIDRMISPGVMMAAMIIMGRALAPVEHAVANWKRVAAGRAARKRLDELFKSLPAPPKATSLPDPKGHIAVENLVLRPARGGSPIVNGVSFAIEAGSVLAIIGPSGGGKSTLAKALAGIWRPSAGAVRLDGASLAHWDPLQLGGCIGYLPQEIDIFPGTIAENVARLGTPNDDAVVAAAKLAGVHEAILKLPHGYETELGDGNVVLSGGMRQRIALARAIYGDPRLVILDEPNSNLDAEGENALAGALRALKARETTIVVVTHKPQLLAHVDYVLVLNAGQIQLFGERDRVLAKINAPKLTQLRQPQAQQAATGIPSESQSSVAAA